MENRPLSELMKNTLTELKTMADANTIIGTPIQAEGVTMIPVSRMSFGVAGGGAEFSTKKQPAGAEPSFGGGSGVGARLEPVAFLIVRDGGVKLLPVAPPPYNTVDRVVEAVPEVVDKVTDFIEKQQEKKARAAEKGDFAE